MRWMERDGKDKIKRMEKGELRRIEREK